MKVSVSPGLAPELSMLIATLKLTGPGVRAKLALVVRVPTFETAEPGVVATLKLLRTLEMSELSAELFTDAESIFVIEDSPLLPGSSETVNLKLRLLFAVPADCEYEPTVDTISNSVPPWPLKTA